MNIITLSVRLYRMLLRLYPLNFRQEYGDEMLCVFRDSCRERHRTSGTKGVIRLWLPLLADLLANAIAERITGRSRRRIVGETILLLVGLALNVAAWVWLWWTMTFLIIIMLVPWEISTPPAGTFAGWINDTLDGSTFLIVTPGIVTVLMSLLVFINAITRYRKYSMVSLCWRFAVSSFLLGAAAFSMLGVPLFVLPSIFLWSPISISILDPRFGMASIYIGLVYVGLLISTPLKLQTRFFYRGGESSATEAKLI